MITILQWWLPATVPTNAEFAEAVTAGTAIAHHPGLKRAGGGSAHGGQVRGGQAQKQRVCRNQDPGERRWSGWKYN